MKKILTFCTFFTLLITATSAHAATSVEVQALTPFNSLTPSNTMKVVSMQKVEFENGVVFEDGTIIEGNIVDVKQPKRAKLNASFKFQPTSYTYNGRTKKIEDEEFLAKYSEKKELNKGEMALSAATTAGEFFLKIPLLSQGVSLVKGMVKNQEDNRLKSGVVQVYKDSPLSYVEEGKDIIINKEDIFYLKFKTDKAEDLDAPPNNVTPVESTTQEQKPLSSNTIQIKQTTVPTVPEEKTPQKIKSIQSIHPEDVLKEVEQAQTAPKNK